MTEQNSSHPSRAQPLAASAYAFLSLVSLAICIGIGWYLLNSPVVTGSSILSARSYYVFVVILGLAVAAFLFGAMRSRARFTGSHLGSVLELGGPAVGAALVVFGAFSLPKPADEFSLVIRLRSTEPITETNDTWIWVDFDGRRDRRPFSALGEAVVPSIPIRFRDTDLPMEFESKVYRIKNPKSAYRAPESGVIYLEVDKSPVAQTTRQLFSVAVPAVPEITKDRTPATAPSKEMATSDTFGKSRFRGDSIRVTATEAIIGAQCWSCASVTFTLENLSGMGFGAGIRQRATSIGGCIGQESASSGLKLLSDHEVNQVAAHENPESLLRYFPVDGKIIVTIQLDGCSAENFAGRSTHVAMSLVMASGKQFLLMPLSSPDVPLRIVRR